MASQIGQSEDSVKTKAIFRQSTESHSSLCHLIMPGWAVQSGDSWSRCSICWSLLLSVLPMMTVLCPLSVTDGAASCPPVLPIFLFVNVPLSSRFSWAHHQRFNWPTFLSARHDWVTEFSQWGILCHQLSHVLKRGPLVLCCLCSSPQAMTGLWCWWADFLPEHEDGTGGQGSPHPSWKGHGNTSGLVGHMSWQPLTSATAAWKHLQCTCTWTGPWS